MINARKNWEKRAWKLYLVASNPNLPENYRQKASKLLRQMMQRLFAIYQHHRPHRIKNKWDA